MRMYRVIENKMRSGFDMANDTRWFDTVAEARAEALELGMPLDSIVQELMIGTKGDLIQTVKNFLNGDYTIDGCIRTIRNLGSNRQVAKLKVVNLFDTTPE
tara:strand:+ start:691 stop:993 length:303 start_codon:yes stop_codon:yes gene_type:complete